jgi:hypothetical protein
VSESVRDRVGEVGWGTGATKLCPRGTSTPTTSDLQAAAPITGNYVHAELSSHAVTKVLRIISKTTAMVSKLRALQLLAE